ncbi:MAG: hypothetical protein H6710_24970 [Myxococcales bacterium]|nr:hypothetical protein [Myxococcales bacterium]MCB9706781.1 hypothetical protein [Myxococcales bacterium]
MPTRRSPLRRSLALSLLGVAGVAACQGRAESPAIDAAPASPGVAEAGAGAGAEALPEPPLTEAERARLAALEWIGDADASQRAIGLGRYSQSGVWEDAEGGRRPLTSSAHILRVGRVLGETGFPVIDETPDGLRLKLFANQTFTPADVRLEIPVAGSLPAISMELAHDKVAIVTWGEATPTLAIYAQVDGASLARVPLEVEGFRPPLVVAWHASGEIVVEWRDEAGYMRSFHDGKSGRERWRERLDPKIAAVIAAPVEHILAKPAVSEEDAAPEPVDAAKETTAQRYLRAPPAALGAVCMMAERENRRVRVDALEDGKLLIAEGVYFDGSDVPGALSVAGATCSSVSIFDPETLHTSGRWSTGRADDQRG